MLLDAGSTVEADLLRSWVDRHRPRKTRVEIHRFHPSAPPPALVRRLTGATNDPLLLPLRIAWMGRHEGERRAVRLRDLLSFGDPRDPGLIRQRIILAKQPDRARVVAGEPALLSEMRAAWESPQGPDSADMSLPAFIALRAGLALERAERQLRGSRYKVPRFLVRDLLAKRNTVAGMASLAAAASAHGAAITARVQRYLKEIAATHSPYVIDLVANGTRLLLEPSYGSRVHYSPEDLQDVCRRAGDHPLVFLPSHKSNLDHLVLHYLLYENDLPPTHTAGGINMNFFPVGPIVRRAGVFFIRRTFAGNDTYKFTLKAYLQYLLEKRFSLEWYIEGGRSRSGKLREPRLGMLSYVVDAWRDGASDDVILVPVSIAYDQIQDVASYAAEQSGSPKEKESIKGLVGFVRNLRRRWGDIHVRFGRPISLAETTAGEFEVPKLAFEVATRINEATPVTPISLVTMTLLAAGRSLTVAETAAALRPYLDYVERRRLPVATEVDLDEPTGVEAALEALADHGVLSRHSEGPETVYGISAEQHLAAAYYRNTIIHFFVDSAIAELAMLGAAESDRRDKVRAFLDEALALRDLLKFEFFFAPRARFVRTIAEEFELKDPNWKQHLEDEDAAAIISSFRPFTSQVVLRPFLEAYKVVAQALANMESAPATKDEVMDASLALGRQLVLQRRVVSPEAVSKELFASGLRLADHRGLLDGSGEHARRQHLAAIDGWLRRVDGVAAWEAGRAAGILGLEQEIG